MPDLTENYREIAQFAGLSDDGRRRKEMLEVACRLAGQPGRCAALLWLYDEEIERFHLDHYEPMDPGRRLARLSMKCDRAVVAAPHRVDEVRAVMAGEPRVAAWLAEKGLGRNRALFRVQPARGADGYLEIVTGSPLAPGSSGLLAQFADVIAVRITRHRDMRRLRVYEQLTEGTIRPERPDGDADLWLQVATAVAREGTSAEAALVFREAPDLSLRVVAADPWQIGALNLAAQTDSLVRGIFERRSQKRVLDHNDQAERLRVFETESFDLGLTRDLERILGGPLRSWIAAAVVCGGEAVAVILVANKKPGPYLPGVFSGTDNEIIKDICNVLSRGLAQAQTNLAIRNISDFTFQHALRDADERHSLLNLVRDHVPGIVAGAVSLRLDEGDAPLEKETWWMGELEPGGAERLRARMERSVRNLPVIPSRRLAPVGRQDSAPGYFVYEERLPHVSGDRKAVVHLLSRRERLANFEVEVLRYLSADLSQLIRSEQIVRRQIEDLVQIRHALRSGIQGLRHIENAWEVYEQIARNGMQPTDFRVAMLRKSLDWTRLFADRCRNLLEESRFLLGQIHFRELRLGSVDIDGLVGETLRCLRPDAEDREIEFIFENRAKDKSVTADRLLLSIAIFNVIDNAVKYSHRNQTIRVRLEVRGKDWVLTVTDTGVYIREADKDSIFQEFVRRPTGQAQHTRPGTGLGLPVVKQVVEAHGGSVEARSEPIAPRRPEDGAITTFTIRVPIKPGGDGARS